MMRDMALKRDREHTRFRAARPPRAGLHKALDALELPRLGQPTPSNHAASPENVRVNAY
ncbi:hypothetical protein PCAR4_150206 [Paraburkholderia caribensis]|nr:hypothetical protein PCAR4_150206 [Paraburkholderia caribensis]